MNKKFTFYLLLIPGVILLMQSCSKGGGGNSPSTDNSLSVSLSKSTIGADNWEIVTITVKDKDNVDVTTSSSIYLNNARLSGNTFYTDDPGNYKIKATRSGATSHEVNLTANNPGPSPFTQKIIVEDYTGTWCGHCPRVGINLDNYVNAGHTNCIVVANHGPSNDPFTFSYHLALASLFGVSGYPSAWVDREVKWNEDNTQLNGRFTNRRPPLGISFQTLVNGNNITGTAKVKFDVTTDVNLKLILYLLEDGKVYPQVNYGYFGLPSTISNYVHNGILRKTITDLYGDNITSSSQVKGMTYEKSFSVDATGYDISKCRIVGFVVQGPNNQNRTERVVLNAQAVHAGSSQDFD